MRGVGSIASVTLKGMRNQGFSVTSKGHVNKQGFGKKMMLKVIIVELGVLCVIFNISFKVIFIFIYTSYVEK